MDKIDVEVGWVIMGVLFILLLLILGALFYYSYQDDLLKQECIRSGGVFVNADSIKGCFHLVIK